MQLYHYSRNAVVILSIKNLFLFYLKGFLIIYFKSLYITKLICLQ
jgi:hypothetical protein